jgi:hypothetical protein
MNTSTIGGKHFISGSQNPFFILTEGVVKIGEMLEKQKHLKTNNNWWLQEEEEMKID